MKPTKQLQHTCNFYFYHNRRQNCLTFNDDFVNFIENYKNEHGESLKEKVQLCIFDPPFGWDMGDHDKMNDIELEKICNIAFHITKPGGTIITSLDSITSKNTMINLKNKNWWWNTIDWWLHTLLNVILFHFLLKSIFYIWPVTYSQRWESDNCQNIFHFYWI